MAANTWQPAQVLKIGTIELDAYFRCVGHRQDGKQCSNPIGRESRSDAQEILRDLSSLDATSDTFEEQLEGLADALLCFRHRENQSSSKVAEWQEKVEEFRNTQSALKKPDAVMAEPWHTAETLREEIDDLTICLRRITTYDPKSNKATTRSSLKIET